ncbi:aldo/keto reductase [Bacillus carboniphilus]|uniref:Aldo/keto reductase n=1 Tax=Bacillus carboniphilus TaxID=86663 RepID=A0ABY9JWP2_9BACI|nr:aldo/keto reductase [Bacillus carboniphilus]WLR42091.1 aldo/keto reductase [Bacillus carboniphilus]
MTTSSSISLRNLGASDLKVSPLGLGTWQFSKGKRLAGIKFWPDLEKQLIQEIVKVSLRGGINWFDTAEIYGKGASEAVLADALNELGDEAKEALICTKWWPAFRRAKSINQTIDQRLEALKGRKIDLYLVHQPFSFSSANEEMNQMAQLLQEGKINHVGVSNFSEKKLREAHGALKEQGFPLVANQMKFSLLDRRIERNGVLDAAKQLGVTIIAYSPLEQGILTGKFHKNRELIKNIVGPRKYLSGFKESSLTRTQPLIDLLERLAKEYDISTSQIALNWTIHFHGETIVAIPGATKKHHAEENIGALTFRLSDKHLAEIDKVSKEVSLK